MSNFIDQQISEAMTLITIDPFWIGARKTFSLQVGRGVGEVPDRSWTDDQLPPDLDHFAGRSSASMTETRTPSKKLVLIDV